VKNAFIVNCFHNAIALGSRQIFSFIFQFSIFHITFVIYHCWSRLVRAMVYDKLIWKMRQQKLPQRSFTLAHALPDISLGLPLSTAMTISSTRKVSRQSGIYTDMLSNANAPLPVKGEYICPGILGGAFWEEPAYGSNTKHALPPHRWLAQQVHNGD
jgi:hypothetical protein